MRGASLEVYRKQDALRARRARPWRSGPQQNGTMVIKPRSPRPVPAHPAERAVRKLRAASARLEAVSSVWDEYRSSAGLTYDPEVDTATGTVRYVAHVAVAPPTVELEDEVRAVVADARSALDNLVYDLGVAHGIKTAQLSRNGFPAVQADRASDWDERSSKSLAGLPQDVVERVRDVQPFSQPILPGLVHPATLLNQLSNDDKHKDGLALGLVPHVPSQHLLAETRFTLPAELASQFAEGADPDEIIDFDPNAVVDGAAVVTLHFPPMADLATLELSPLDLPLSLTLLGKRDDLQHPLLPSLRNALRWARETARYVSGGSDQVPEPYDPSLVVPAVADTVET